LDLNSTQVEAEFEALFKFDKSLELSLNRKLNQPEPDKGFPPNWVEGISSNLVYFFFFFFKRKKKKKKRKKKKGEPRVVATLAD
jgi:hypothetical protein